MIDLHTHTTASDGTQSPAELVACARRKGLKALAVTDHDTVGGLDDALAAGRREGLEVVPGIEISAACPGGTLHILGYYMDYRDPSFQQNISVLQEARRQRNPRIAAKLQALGFDIEMEEVRQAAGGGQVGRPHFARLLVEKGCVRNPQEAFDKYLKKGAAAYEDKFRFPIPEAISHILSAGGIPVLAHPVTLGSQPAAKLDAFVAELVGHGLMGMEVYYPDHSPGQVRQYLKIAAKHRLLVTGGSDFHGLHIKGLDLGTGRGSLKVPCEVLEALKSARR